MKIVKLFFVAMAFLVACVTSAFAVDMPSVGEPLEPPAGTLVNITNDGIVTVKGPIEIYGDLVYVYGGREIETAKLVSGTATIPARRWVNLIFKGEDGLWHFLLVKYENTAMPTPWMGDHLCAMPDFGNGSALTNCDWLRKGYISRSR